jgi:Tfp pilus assembly protein PilV
MINTNLFRRRRAPRGQLGPSHAHTRLAAQDGVSLIEVMVSALMVGFIVIATVTGFNAANHTTADERTHDQAAQLAAQSLEEMRSDSAATLDTIEKVAGVGPEHTYTQTIGGQKYTIGQSDEWIPDNNPNANCSASSKEHSSQAGNYLRIATSVDWHQLEVEKRPPLRQYSIITPPDGSGLEVDVVNGRTPEQPVAGVTVVAGEAEATTGEAGCAILGGIPATKITVAAFKVGDVTEAGAVKNISPELAIAPNVTTHKEVVLNTGSHITAEFMHGSEKVKGDTIVAYNPKMNLAPDFEVGSTRFGTFTKETGEYEARTGEPPITEDPEPYRTTATTPVSPEYYPTGDLFPFEKGPWQVYAGDCLANNPAEIDPSEVSKSSISAALEPGEDPTIKVPTSEVQFTIYKSTKSGSTIEGTVRPVKITNTECLKIKKEEEEKNKTTYLPNNAAKYSVIHTQDTTNAGKLEVPYQPFGKFTLCVWNNETKRTYTTTYTDEKALGPTINFYLGESANYTESGGHSVEVKTGQFTNTC